MLFLGLFFHHADHADHADLHTSEEACEMRQPAFSEKNFHFSLFPGTEKLYYKESKYV